MQNDKQAVASGGIGFGTLLFCIFLVLKLLGKIGWSWWWVTAPLWIPIAFVLLVLVAMLIVALISAYIINDAEKRG
jgi:hypothetical protein